MKMLLMAALLASFCFVYQASAQKRTRVRFIRGSDATTVVGKIRGYAYRDYIVRASAGQTITIGLFTSGDAVFTVFRPGGDNLEGAVETDSFTTELPVKGDYVIRVLMPRGSAAQRLELEL